jgi:hypothetical protein
MRLGPVEVEVVQLDDGRRLITPEGMMAVLDWLAEGGAGGKSRNDELSQDTGGSFTR